MKYHCDSWKSKMIHEIYSWYIWYPTKYTHDAMKRTNELQCQHKERFNQDLAQFIQINRFKRAQYITNQNYFDELNRIERWYFVIVPPYIYSHLIHQWVENIFQYFITERKKKKKKNGVCVRACVCVCMWCVCVCRFKRVKIKSVRTKRLITCNFQNKPQNLNHLIATRKIENFWNIDVLLCVESATLYVLRVR